MNKINYALAMLSVAGGAVAAAPAAQAVTLYGTFSSVQLGFTETFSLQSDGGYASSAGPDYTDFALTNDSLGNTVAVVGDNTTGFKAEIFGNPIDGYFGTGTTDTTFGTLTYDSLVPALYTAGGPAVLSAGTYVGDFNGSILTLSAAPEPDTWALLIAGAALVGGAARVSRRRAPAAA